MFACLALWLLLAGKSLLLAIEKEKKIELLESRRGFLHGAKKGSAFDSF